MNKERTVSIAVIICAAGSSKRMGGVKKEYQKIDKDKSETVLETVAWKFITFSPSVEFVCITVVPNDKDAVWDMLPEEFNLTSRPLIRLVNGGKTRQESVYNALCSLDEYKPDYVLIHDAARPWVSDDIIFNVISAMKKHGAAIPVLPLADTPKECKDGFIARHLKRHDMGLAQTPQGFKFEEILRAHEKAAEAAVKNGEEFTDDAEVWGRFIGDVAVVPGEPENRKITYQGDL